MKKFFFSILAVGALVACTKSEVKYEGETEIAFSPVASVATKANVMHAIDGTVYPAAETFKVWGYWQLLGAGNDNAAFTDATTYIDAKQFAKAVDGTLWRGAAKPYYWPKTGSMVFACLSPDDAPVTNLTHDVETDNFRFDFAGTANTAETVDIMWSNTTNSYTEETAAAGVPVTFNHALSWITFKVKGDAVTSNGGFVINSLVMDQLYTGGTFTSNNKTWSSQKNPVAINVFTGSPRNLTTDYAVLEDVTAGTLVLPQDYLLNKNYTATIKFTNTLGDTNINETVTLDLGRGWEIGKHYTYYITFTATEILIAPEVTDWEEVDPAGEYEF